VNVGAGNDPPNLAFAVMKPMNYSRINPSLVSLVIDEDVGIRRMLRVTLETNHYRVKATNGPPENSGRKERVGDLFTSNAAPMP